MNRVAILIYSCQKNSDMWAIFCKLFDKYWSNCSYEKILLTDKYPKGVEDVSFDQIVESDGNWHDMIVAGISQAKTKYVMLFMDDYLLCDYVDEKKIESFVDDAEKYSAANIRFAESPTIPYSVFSLDAKYHLYEAGTAYSFSTQVGLWNAECLKNYINPVWSAWDFERIGSMEIQDLQHPLLGSATYRFPYEEGVRRGRWMDVGVRLCERNEINIDFTKRPQMTNFQLAWIYFKGGILAMNPSLIVRIQNVLQRKKN